MSWPIRRVLSLAPRREGRPSIYDVRCRTPLATYPDALGEQPSSASCLVLLRVGFTLTDAVTSAAVSSYLTFSPLPPAGTGGGCFLWHFPAGRPGWSLATTLPCGARTFLGAPKGNATAWPTHPLLKHRV